MDSIVILGGGAGGTIAANRLLDRLGRTGVQITVVDRDDRHVYQPGLAFVPFGLADLDEITRSRARQLHAGIRFVTAGVARVEVDDRRVHLRDGTVLGYDVLVVATGAAVFPDQTPGLTGRGWGDSIGTFCTSEQAPALAQALERFDGGRIVITIVGMPIKCPLAPLEFGLLADWYLQERKLRGRTELTVITPLEGACAAPADARTLGRLLDDAGISLVTGFATSRVDGSAGRLVAADDRTIGFDLAVVMPLHGGAEFVGASRGLGDALGFIPTDTHTLQSTVAPNVFAIGDAAGLPSRVAGWLTDVEGRVLAENVHRLLVGKRLDASYGGRDVATADDDAQRAMEARGHGGTGPGVPCGHPAESARPAGVPVVLLARLAARP